jgi:hypothetical protein
LLQGNGITGEFVGIFLENGLFEYYDEYKIVLPI